MTGEVGIALAWNFESASFNSASLAQGGDHVHQNASRLGPAGSDKSRVATRRSKSSTSTCSLSITTYYCGTLCVRGLWGRQHGSRLRSCRLRITSRTLVSFSSSCRSCSDLELSCIVVRHVGCLKNYLVQVYKSLLCLAVLDYGAGGRGRKPNQ